MQDVNIEPSCLRGDGKWRPKIATSELTWHRQSMDAKGRMLFERLEQGFRLRVIGDAVDDQADVVALRGKIAGQIRNMPEQPADWRAQDLQYAQTTSRCH